MGGVHVKYMGFEGKKSFLTYVVSSNGVSSVFGTLASDLEASIVKNGEQIEYFIRTTDPTKAREIYETIREHGLAGLGKILRQYHIVEIKVIAHE